MAVCRACGGAWEGVGEELGGGGGGGGGGYRSQQTISYLQHFKAQELCESRGGRP